MWNYGGNLEAMPRGKMTKTNGRRIIRTVSGSHILKEGRDEDEGPRLSEAMSLKHESKTDFLNPIFFLLLLVLSQ
jgi:hypothetical protein